MRKHKLSADELNAIKEHENSILDRQKRIEECSRFKVNDYVVKYKPDHKGNYVLATDSYGAPQKYVVVHVGPDGAPWAKRVNHLDNIQGELIYMAENYDEDGISFNYANIYNKWELDPEYADSMILGESYDPNASSEHRRKLYKEITQYNKSIKIDTSDFKPIVEFLKTLKVGDNIWTSNNNHYHVQQVDLLDKKDAARFIDPDYRYRIKGPKVIVLTLSRKNQITQCAADHFLHKAIYKERPRSYNELKI